MVAICVDAGTSVVKTVVFDDDGIEIAVARQSVPVDRTKPGCSEQDMYAVRDAVFTTIRQTVASVHGTVRFLAITAQGDGCWLIDSSGVPTGPAILWNDGRAASIVDQWQQEGVADQAFALNGTQVFPGAQNAIMRWLYEHDRARLERSATALYCKDWIAFCLTGVVGTDESDASCPYFDIRARRYADDLLQLYGLAWAKRLLPPVRQHTTPVGTLLPAVAQELGLPVALPVVVAPYDIATTALGLGAVQPGQAVSILGTTLCNEIIVDNVNTEGNPSGLLICSGLPGRWIRGFATMCGTEAISWFSQFLGDVHPSELTEMAKTVPPGAGGVFFLPYLSPAGERAPFRDAYARGTIVGLSLEQKREHVARALLEGLSFVIRECLEATTQTATVLNVCGGGSNSELWCQLIADITHIPVRTTTTHEVGAMGALFVGLVATRQVASIEEAAQKYSRTRTLYQPDAAMVEQYEDFYQNFLAVRNIIAADWLRRAQSRIQQTTATGKHVLA